MPRPSNKLQRQQEIADALLKVMASKGYDGSSIQEIAKTAGLTPGLIHYHFKTKQDILLAAIDKIILLENNRYKQLLTISNTPRARVKAYVDARLALGTGADLNAVKAWVLIGAEAVRQIEIRRLYADSMAKQKERLIYLLNDYCGKAIIPEKIENLAATVLAIMEGAFQLSVTSKEIMPVGYAAKAVMLIIDQTISAQL